jgi:two-component system phosphate regulon sensor histidine kinase PhoR
LRLNVRIKIFLVCLGLLLGALVAADQLLSRFIVEEMTTRLRAQAASELALLAEQARGAQGADREAWQRVVARGAALTRSTLTATSPDGRLLAAAGDAPPRSEAQDALLREALARPGAVAFADLEDLTLPRISAALSLPGPSAFVLHLDRPAAEVTEARVSLQRLLGGHVAVALLVSLLVAALGPVVIRRDVRDLTRAALHMSEGDLDLRLGLMPGDPYAQLGRALDHMSERLSRHVTDLRTERDLMGSILEGMEEGVVVLDENRRVVLINRALSSILLVDPHAAPFDPSRADGGPSPLDATGKPLLDVVGAPELGVLLDRTVAAGRATGEIELGDLKPRRLLVRITRIEGDPRGYLGVFVDVTEVRRLESLRRDFVANVSHELRTPIASVRTAAETVRDTLTRDPQAAVRFVAIIERNAERLHSLVEDLLDLSRIESREYRLNPEALEPARVVAEVATLFRERAEARRIRVEVDAEADLPTLQADRRALEQVLVNLIDNAVKYCPPEASITLTARAEAAPGAGAQGDLVAFAVADTGPGIEAIHLPRLFERFYRVDPGRSRDRGGTGLGLAIVKHLVEAMGGEVGVRSELGRGTTFTVRLPLEAPARTARPT